MILPISEGGFFGARKIDGYICIGDTSLSKYIPKIYKTNEKQKQDHMWMRNLHNCHVTSIRSQ